EMVHVRSLARLAIIHALLNAERDSRSYRRGFLAGFFDAEGHNGDSLRLSQVDVSVLERVRRYAAGLGFTFDLEPHPGRASPPGRRTSISASARASTSSAASW